MKANCLPVPKEIGLNEGSKDIGTLDGKLPFKYFIKGLSVSIITRIVLIINGITYFLFLYNPLQEESILFCYL